MLKNNFNNKATINRKVVVHVRKTKCKIFEKINILRYRRFSDI